MDPPSASGQTPSAAPSATREASRHLGDLLLQPVALAALVVLVINDHVAKDRWPSTVTGKASDVAGLVFFPLLMVAIGEAIRWLFRRDSWPLDRRALAIAIGVTAFGFAAIKVWGPAGDAYRVGNGVVRWPLDAIPALLRGDALPPVGTVKLTEDRTDLFALIALFGAWWAGNRILNRRQDLRQARLPRAPLRPQGTRPRQGPHRRRHSD